MCGGRNTVPYMSICYLIMGICGCHWQWSGADEGVPDDTAQSATLQTQIMSFINYNCEIQFLINVDWEDTPASVHAVL